MENFWQGWSRPREKLAIFVEKYMTTMKDHIRAFDADMNAMLEALQERVKRYQEESASYMFEAENKMAGMTACINKLKVDYEKQLAINKCATLEKRELEKHFELLKGELERMRIVQAASSHEALTDVAAHNETAVAAQAEVRQRIYGEVIEKLIAEAEHYPSNQNDKAEAIKSAIQALLLAEGVQLPAELRARLQNLGRKEAAMARAMVEVTGNEKVIFGGQSNG